MTETNKENYHLEALHYLTNVSFDSSIGVRANKVNVLDNLRFSKGTNMAVKREFQLPGNEDGSGIRNYLLGETKKGRFVSMLFNGMGWEGSGGSPVVYIMSDDDVDEKLVFDGNKLSKVTGQDDTTFDIDRNLYLQTYSRLRSTKMRLAGFDNYENPIDVRVGGGFRLQLDNISLASEQLSFTLSSCFSFNDMGSRVLALSSEKDRNVPRYSKNFNVVIKEGQIVYNPTDELNRQKQGNVENVVNSLLTNLFRENEDAISKLYRSLLNVRPSLKTHQLEGIFSVTNEFGVSMEVIDFDGIETFDLYKQPALLNPTERLTSALLVMSGYSLPDSEIPVMYAKFRSTVRESLRMINDSYEISEAIKQDINKLVDPNSTKIFSQDLAGPVKLGRLLKALRIDLEITQIPEIRKILTSDGEITSVTIQGFEMAFWEVNGTTVDCSNIKKLSGKLSAAIGREIVESHYSYLDEGD
jgi:hypothetical protein